MRALTFTWWYIRFFFWNAAVVHVKFFGGLLGLAWFALLFPRALYRFWKEFKK